MSETTSKKKVPTIFIEMFERRESGFIRDETEGTSYEERLTGPSKLIVPSEGFRRIPGDPDGGVEEIRYIAGVTEISKMKQDAAGIKPHRGITDKIVLENGTGTICKEGATIGKYNYLNEVFWRGDLPNRSENATAIYKVVDLDKIEEINNEFDLAQNEASAFVYTLQTKKGTEWVYQEQRIDALCTLFNVFAERPSSKIAALVGLARLSPKEFLNKVKIFEQTAATMIAHALQLNVIKFEGNVAMYLIKDKIIKNLGSGTMKQDEKIEQLSQFLRSADGNESYHELTAEVENAKNKMA